MNRIRNDKEADAAVLRRMPPAIGEIIARLNRGGYEAYVVGGCVRDALLGREPHDWDICSSALPQEVVDCFPERTVHPTGLKHGTVLLSWEGEGIEITTFRTEGGYSDHRHPDKVTFVRSLDEDLGRRDFTVNSMAFHPERGIVDPFGGQRDLRAGVIRCVGEAERRFQEDGLRILRALRFASRYGFTIEEETARAMDRCRELLRWIAVERIFQELKGILCGAGVGPLLLEHREIIALCLPELRPTFDFDQHNHNHCYDVWEHTVRSVENAPPDPVVRLAMLFHDIGKPETFALDEQGVGHCLGHPEVSAKITRAALRRMRCDRETMDAVAELVAAHDHAGRNQPRGGARYDRNRFFTRRSVRRMLARMGERQLRRLFHVMEADVKAQAPETVPGKMEKLLSGYAMLDAVLAEGACFTIPDLAVNGRDLIAMGLKPGVFLGSVLKKLFREVLDGNLENNRDVLLAAARTYIANENG